MKSLSKRRKPPSTTTQFLNVDLDIYSRSPLEPFADALRKKAHALYVGRELGLFSAHLEVAGYPKNAEVAIRSLASMIEALPSDKRNLWDTARRRDFNIGVQAAHHDRPFEIELEAQTVSAVASLNARIVVTIYAPDLLVSNLRSRSAKLTSAPRRVYPSSGNGAPSTRRVTGKDIHRGA